MSSRSRNAQRIVRPKRNRRRIKWVRLILHLAVLAIAVEVVFVALTSPRLQIRRIEVRGAKTIRVADLQACGRSAIGSNFFLANATRVRRSVRKNPVVRNVRVSRWPLNKLIIRVEERVPYAVVHTAAGFYLIDSEGFVFRSVGSAPKRLLLVDLANCGTLRPGVFAPSDLLKPVLECLVIADENGFNIAKISVDPERDMCLNMVSGLSVRIGRPEGFRDKFASLKRVLAGKPDLASQAAYVDVSSAPRPSWKPKQPSSTL